MEFHSKKLEGLQNKLLIGQFIQDKLCRIYFEYELQNPLNNLMDDLSVKQSLSEFLNKIQDITSLINFGLKPIGLYFKGELPEYCRNNSILKKICNIFNIDTLLLYSQNQQLAFSSKNITTSVANIKIIDQFDLRRIQLQTSLRFNLGQQINVQNTLDKVRKNYENLNLLNYDQILLQQQQLNEITNQKEIILGFFAAQTQSSECVQNDQTFILQGDLSILILADSKITIQDIRTLILNDILESVKVRLSQELNPPCYLAKRLLITFKQNDLVLQNYIDHEFNKEQEINYINQYFPNLQIDQIKIMESKQIIKLEQPKQQLQQQQQQQEQVKEKIQEKPKEVVEQQNQQQQQEIKGKVKQEYLIMVAIFGILIAIYLKTLF
ncbi:unnamed protein product [Paramecium primaurelia]|uniref:Transmembrane protein n=1 Tax=Paramecium primaurelia TaxID=5886 RepID=A0A8S1LC28_PARPR|nr:unnamed protein product [Paramecium primaurelia]